MGITFIFISVYISSTLLVLTSLVFSVLFFLLKLGHNKVLMMVLICMHTYLIYFCFLVAISLIGSYEKNATSSSPNFSFP